VIGHGPEQHGVGGALQPQPELGAGHGVFARLEDRVGGDLGLGVEAPVGELHDQPLFVPLDLAHLDREPPIDRSGEFAQDDSGS
jgi:hypothetical protein